MQARPDAPIEMPDLWTNDLYAHLAEVSLDEPSAFARSVLVAICERFNLAAASFYIRVGTNANYRLRAQIGFDYARYANFDLPAPSFPSEAEIAGRPTVSQDLRTSPLFRDKALLDGAQIDTLVTVPLPVPPASAEAARSFEAPNPLGALCLYPRDPKRAPDIARFADQLAPFIARLYLATVERATMRLRRVTVERVAFRKDVSSLAHSFLELMLDELSVDAGALWVVDSRREVLYRRRALNARAPEVRGILPSLSPQDSSLIAETFRTKQVSVHDTHRSRLRQADVDLELSSPLNNWYAVPITLPDEATLRGRRPGVAGVLELANHASTIDGVTHLTSPDWEDLFRARFACELLSVLLFQVLRTQDHESDFERLLHGARQSLQAARSHLQGLESLDLETAMPDTHRHLIPNAIDWLEDLEAQINRDDIVHKAEVRLEPIPLFGEVLAKLGPMVRRMNTRSDRKLLLLGLDEVAHDYRRLPLVLGNRQALDCVFRNLLDNSRKYCRPEAGASPEVRLRVLTNDDGDTVVVFLSDNGEGIPRDEAAYVFEDGFRGQIARGIQPQGVGRGLYDCLRLMKAMKGDIAVMTAGEGVTFRLELRAAPTVGRR